MLTKHTLFITALTALFGGIAAADTDVHFGFDSSQLSPSATQAIEQFASRALSSGQAIVLDGHADPTGAADYNVGLSLRRAEAVRDQLVKLGIDSDRIVIASFGEDALMGGSHAQERRVSLSLSNDSIASLIDDAFTSGGTSVTWEKPVTTAQLDEPITDAVATR
ncbi:MAG: OmpA family protein [Myxococcales bacterium]|nr:OmpA family protein [Myxococcales bacterium]